MAKKAGSEQKNAQVWESATDKKSKGCLFFVLWCFSQTGGGSKKSAQVERGVTDKKNKGLFGM
ncbi:MAG: hypothetical protein HQL90_15005 [Magnetococcales bacterium]|nr:hypothetical protein [Magnetococcales bacterium]